jgi:hypothetical protein
VANEIRVQSSLTIQAGNLQFQSLPQSFQLDMTGRKGPTPGAIAVSTSGTSVSLTELTTPGACVVANLDTANAVHLGLYDPETFRSYFLMKIHAGKAYAFYLSDLLGDEILTGTGTGGASTVRLRLIAENATVNVVVAAFEA